jgi:hypothetical protein
MSIVNPIPAMALPVAPPLPLTTGISLEHAAKMLSAEEETQNKEKDTTAAAAAAAAAARSENDDDVQLDREILELMGGWVSLTSFTNKPFLCLRILSSLPPLPPLLLPPLSLSHT